MSKNKFTELKPIMMKEANVGGINGLGKSLIDTKSDDFKYLQNLIQQKYESLSRSEKISNDLLSIRFQMESYLSSTVSADEIKLPGYFIELFLSSIGVSKKQLSNYVEYEYSNLIALIKGRRKVNSDLAIKLGQIFRIEPVIWLHIESKNELMKELVKSKNNFSLKELLKRAS